MGRKINPIGFRLGVYRNWHSQWYAHKRDFSNCLYHDYLIRQHIMKTCKAAMISKILITRLSSHSGPTIEIRASRPGMIIGSKGEDIDNLRAQIHKITGTQDATVDVKEIKNPDADANLIAQNIASRLEKRQRTRRVVQSAFQSIARLPQVLGVKIRVKGRLDGADIARKEYRHEGRVPLHTLRADIDYGFAEATTTMGKIGIKVWVFLGERSVRQKQHKHMLMDEVVVNEDGITELVSKDNKKEKAVKVSGPDAQSDEDFFDEEFVDGEEDNDASS